MSRPGPGLSVATAAAALTAAVLAVAACQADVGDADCQLTQQVVLAGSPSSPLLLLPNVRLDQVGDGFFLLGSDGTTVRWAAMAADGTLSPEQAFALPAGVTDPVYAVAAVNAPGDTVLVAYPTTGAASAQGEIDVVAVAADGSQPPAPANPVLTFAAGVPPASAVVMSSSRLGNDAGLAWIDAQSNRVMFATVNGEAALVGQPTPIAVSAAAGPSTVFSCLGFSPGKDNLTVGYLNETSDGSSPPTWVIAEANEGGTIDTTTTLNVAKQMGCAVVTPTATEYALVWQDNQASWIAVSAKVGSNQIQVVTYPFASASDFGGPDLQPPLVGLAPLGSDFGVVLARAHDVELWRLDDMGNRKPGTLNFPSLGGNLGSVSALPVDGALVATYADYSSPPGTANPSGRRLFVNATCY
jgi:hypothetical protein